MRNVPALDGLRAIAILSVMAFHAGLWFVRGGSLGVDMFFVLSGWLITSILIKEVERTGAIDCRAFFIRRLQRLLPGLVVLLVAYLLFIPILASELAERRWFDVATSLFYVTNLRQTFWPANTPLSHTWSLAVEAQFYLLWPFIIPRLVGIGRSHAAVILCALWATLSGCRLLWEAEIGGPGAYYFSPLHATGLVLGAALAFRPGGMRQGCVALGVLVALMIGVNTHQSFLAAQPIAEIAVVILIADPPRLLEWPPFRAVGKISYGIYLWHIPIQWIMPATSPREIAIYFSVSILAGAASYLLIERFFMRDRNPRIRGIDTSADTGSRPLPSNHFAP